MTDTFEQAVCKLEEALYGPDGELRPVDRIEFEPLDSGQVKWSIWEHGRLIYSASGWPDDLTGLLTATKTILELRCGSAP